MLLETIYNMESIRFLKQNMPSLTEVASAHQYRPGQILFYAEHFPYGLFILTEGEVEIQYLTGFVEHVRPGAILGASAFLKNKAYCGTAKTIGSAKLYFISKTQYQELKEQQHPVNHWVTELLYHRLHSKDV